MAYISSVEAPSSFPEASARVVHTSRTPQRGHIPKDLQPILDAYLDNSERMYAIV